MSLTRNVQPKRTHALSAAFALVLTAVLAIGAFAGATHAYLASKSDTYLNTFVSGLPDVGELTITGTKTLEGRSLAEGEFSFALYETDSSFTVLNGAEPLQAGTNTQDGTFAFDALEFTKTGTFHYAVTEQIPDADDPDYRNHVSYDATQYRITVTVTESGGAFVVDKGIVAGQGLDPASSATETEVEAIAFANVFDSPDPTVVVNGLKVLDGREMNAGEFEFDLYEANPEYTVPEGAAPVQSASNTGAGASSGFGFAALSYSSEGTYCYVIREDASAALGGVTYDDEAYRLKIVVAADSVTGVLSAEATLYMQSASGEWIEAEKPKADAEDASSKPYASADPQNGNCAVAFVTFDNSYKASPTSYEFTGDVDLEGRDMAEGEFSFTIEPAADGAPIPGVNRDDNDSSGGFDFGSAEFTEPGAYEYVVRQNASTALEGITYDESVHRVIVTVVDDGAGKLVVESAAVLRDGVEVTDDSGVKYVNTYAKPDDGEDDPDDPIIPPGPGVDDDDPDLPGTGDGSVVPSGPEGSGAGLEQTGDGMPVILISGVALVALVIATAAFIMGRRSQR